MGPYKREAEGEPVTIRGEGGCEDGAQKDTGRCHKPSNAVLEARKGKKINSSFQPLHGAGPADTSAR